ncbi:hypothetical protein BGX33_002776, partial [Mortierella sp. NVP41]
MFTSKAKLVITVGGNIEVIFTPPYHCVCEAPQSTKRNLQRHIQGCKVSSRFKFFDCSLYSFCFICLFCLFCSLCLLRLLCPICLFCFLYTPRQHAGSISIHIIAFGE